MTYTLERPEPGIQLLKWTGTLTEAEFKQSVLDRKKLADEQGDKSYVTIMDITGVAVKSINFRLAIWGANYDKRLKYVIIINPSITAKTVLNLVARTIQFNYEIVDTLEQAMQRARAVREREKLDSSN
ncbi:MAG: hypothetical protein JNJ61_00955 [Anaerolineae bacterium]|nr:hypothetical protein [Anaerolineae bacterium]